MRPHPPLPENAACCLFLDIDGTLVDFAPTPHEVRVDEALRDLLRKLDLACEGAVAFVSGHAIVDIDELFDPLYLAAAGVHGCERRDADGHWRRPSFENAALGEYRTRLDTRLRALDRVWIEDKVCGLAIHFRQAPHLEIPLRNALAQLTSLLPAGYEALDGDCVIDIKPRSHNKATAIEAFMQEAPFAGRLPVFIGDDLADEDGFATVRRFRGLPIGVGERVATEWRLPDPSAVRRWLESFLLRKR